uniref:Ubiquitin-like domain-containing protein n=1 Tax=Meloidogyne hapla TaxID=6305 RepID=A0A1I8BZB7_MELHA
MEKQNISIEIFNAKTPRNGITIENVSLNDDILFLKKKFSVLKNLAVERISFRLEPTGKNIADNQLISELKLPVSNAQLYYRDLGPQIAWKTVINKI